MTDQLEKKRILIVDDSEGIRLMVATLLSSSGYEIAAAENGEECLATVTTFHPDLILLDIMMPLIHGIDVLKQLKSDTATSHIGVIMCSGKDFKPDKDLTIRHGAYAFITKPFSFDELLTTIEGYFSGEGSPATLLPPVTARVHEFSSIIEPTTPYIRFWGTRGSIPVSGPAFIHHGGNTPCLEINVDGMTVVVDAGTGIRELGVKLKEEHPRPLHLFIGHTHWDHIQGFPFFVPAYLPGTSLTVYGASGFGKDLRSIFSGQLDSDYFPVQLQDLSSSILFNDLKDNPVIVGNFQMHWCYVHHQGAAVGFKFALGGKTIVYMTDNEFLKGYLGAPDPALISHEMKVVYRELIDFITGADVLIAEAQYMDDEYPFKIGWGHTSLTNGCLLCKLAKVKQWIITHHDPMHSDEFLEKKLAKTKEVLESISYQIPVSLAADGMIEYF
ncbi:MAG: response regulator [Bacteriovoracaceae bacterium]|nr:response regulator [Bacteroidota bacterium]